MNGEFVLDTNIVIRLINRDPRIEAYLGELEKLLVPTVVIGELVFGAFRSARKEHNLKQIDRIAAGLTIVNVDIETSHCYGQLKQQLFAAGTPIPSNDLWIAATSVRFNATLITLDQHFSVVKGITAIHPQV